MELDDSDSSCEPPRDPVEITELNPLTQGITAKNANCCLLRLPQEIKNYIYELVLGGQLIHLHREGVEKFSHHLCKAKISGKEAHEIFVASNEPWYSADITNRHNACYDERVIDHRGCFKCPDQSDPAIEAYAGLSLNVLRCCRQMYQEARSIIFSANILSFANICGLLDFCLLRLISQIPIERQLSIHRLHLDIIIRVKEEEMAWNMAFHDIPKHLKSLQYIYIDIEQRPLEDGLLKRWQFKEPAESSFLESLGKLRKSRLRDVKVTICDYHIPHSGPKSMAEEIKKYRWTMAQKQKWAGYVKRVLLRQEDQEPVHGERN